MLHAHRGGGSQQQVALSFCGSRTVVHRVLHAGRRAGLLVGLDVVRVVVGDVGFLRRQSRNAHNVLVVIVGGESIVAGRIP